MLRVAFWLGTPALITFLASPAALRLENTLVIFALCVIALCIDMVPRFSNNGRL